MPATIGSSRMALLMMAGAALSATAMPGTPGAERVDALERSFREPRPRSKHGRLTQCARCDIKTEAPKTVGDVQVCRKCARRAASRL